MDLYALKYANIFHFYEFEDSINNIYIDDVNGCRRCKHYDLFFYFKLYTI